MKHIIYHIILVLLCLSCGTRKASYSEKRDVNITQSGQTIDSSATGVSISDSTGIRLSRELSYRITRLFPPDSLGRQYLASIEEGIIKEGYKSEREVKTDSTVVYKTNTESSITITDKSKIKAKEGTDNRPVSAWVWLLMPMAGIAVFYVIKERGK
jgi:hypothetical protein